MRLRSYIENATLLTFYIQKIDKHSELLENIRHKIYIIILQFLYIHNFNFFVIMMDLSNFILIFKINNMFSIFLFSEFYHLLLIEDLLKYLV